MTDHADGTLAEADGTPRGGREVDAFAYWPHYASALPGFGGGAMPHEPRYCFCTEYEEMAPGRACFIVRMTGVRVTVGEIALRVHAMRSGDPPEIVLTTTGYIRLDEVRGDRLEYRVAFAAVEGLRYCLYAIFSDPSDLRAEAVAVTLEEERGSLAIRANLGGDGRSRLARPSYASSHRLVAPAGTRILTGLSHAGPAAPLAEKLFHHDELASTETALHPLRRWEATAALQALELDKADVRGAHGLVIDDASSAIGGNLLGYPVSFETLDAAEAADLSQDDWESRVGAYDFVVSAGMRHTAAIAEARLRAVGAGLRCLRGRGVGVFLMPFWTGLVHDARPAAAAHCLDRNAVQQIALRLIGQSYSVGQLAFPHPPEGGGEITSFILIVHKLA